MENKTLKPGRLATVKSEFSRVRGIVRASKNVDEPCHKCYQQNGNMPCRYLMSLEKCQQMFGWHMFPIVMTAKVYVGQSIWINYSSIP